MRTGHQIAAILLFLGLASGCDPSDPVAEIWAQHEQAQFAATLEPLRALLEQRPADAELHFLYGVALARSGEPGLAIWPLRRAREDERWAVPAGLELAADAYAARSYRAAEEAATEVLGLEPNNLRALHLRGEARLEDKLNLEGALADFDAVLALEPTDFSAQLSRFATLLALERAEDAQAALALLEKLATEKDLAEGEHARLCVTRATFAKERKETTAAEEHFEACLEAYPNSALVVDEAVRFYDERGRSERSTEILNAALEQAPEGTAYRVELANRLRNQGRAPDAEALLREGTRLESARASAEASWALAQHHVSLEQLPEAIAVFERAGELSGGFSQQQILGFADLLAAAEMNERALEVAQDLDQESFRQLIQARVLLNQHRPAEALELYKTALKLWPNNAVARYYAARAAEQIGDFEAAIEQYRQSIRAAADATDAGLRLARLHAAEGDLRAAEVAAGQHMRAHPGDPDATLLAIELAQRTSHQNRLRNLYAKLPPSSLRARAAAQLAATTAATQGPEAALAFLRSDPHLDLSNERDVEALRSVVTHLLEAGEAAEARTLIEKSLASRPEDPNLHELRGRVLGGEGAPPDQVEEAYRRALELDPHNAHAREALGMLAVSSGRSEEGLSLLCDRAGAGDAAEQKLSLRCAEELAEAGRPQEAETRLETFAREVPWSPRAALALARLHWNRRAGSTASELAERALRFGGGRQARALLDEIRQDQSSPNS